MKKIILALLIFFGLSSFVFGQEYIYFYGQGCPHCAKVDEYMTSVDWYNKLNIKKNEVYNNKNNSVEMMKYARQLGLNESEVWVPFLVIKDWEKYTHLIWDKPIIDHFKTYLWEPQKNDNKKYIAIWVILAIVWVIVFMTIRGGNKNTSKVRK